MALLLGVFLGMFGASSTSACLGPDLSARVALQGGTGAMEGGVIVTNRTSRRCTVVGRPGVSFFRAGQQLHVRVADGPSTTGARRPHTLTLRPRERAFVHLRWSNWCGAPSARITVRLLLRSAKSLVVRGTSYTPRCDDAHAVSVVRVGPWEPLR
ncbi:MAG: DUF4232 domain-containing protein [Gaiellaceae bacterium]